VATGDDYEEMRDAGAIDEDPLWWAEDILLVERAKGLLLAGTADRKRSGVRRTIEGTGPSISQIRSLRGTLSTT
jgi:hypothetical protein